MKKIQTANYNRHENAKIELLIERKVNQLLAKKLSATNGDFKKLYMQISNRNFSEACKELRLFNQAAFLSPPIPQNFQSSYNHLLNDFTKMVKWGIFRNF
jgi:hypothetical protein